MKVSCCNDAIVAAYAIGAYSYHREIAEHFDLHLETIGRIVRGQMQQCETPFPPGPFSMTISTNKMLSASIV